LLPGLAHETTVLVTIVTWSGPRDYSPCYHCYLVWPTRLQSLLPLLPGLAHETTVLVTIVICFLPSDIHVTGLDLFRTLSKFFIIRVVHALLPILLYKSFCVLMCF